MKSSHLFSRNFKTANIYIQNDLFNNQVTKNFSSEKKLNQEIIPNDNFSINNNNNVNNNNNDQEINKKNIYNLNHNFS